MRAPWDGIEIQGVYGRSWKQFGTDLWKEIGEDNVFNGAAALGFYLTLAIFPALIFLLNLIPYLPIENLQAAIFSQLDQLLPEDSAEMLSDTVVGVVSTKNEGLLSIGALLTIWAASSGIYALMQQLNITYDVVEERPFWKARLVALGLVVLFGALTIAALALVVAGDALKSWLSTQFFWNGAFSLGYEILRWGVVLVSLALAFSLMFYLAPNVKQEFRFVTPGSAFAVFCIFGASLAFKAYISGFADYNATYGSIGTVIVLMMWLNIMGLVTLLGSEINSLLEHYSPEGKQKGELAPGEKQESSSKKIKASPDLPSKTA